MKKTVAVLMGGTSAEREISLNSGKQIREALKKLGKYEVKTYDPATDLVKLVENKEKIDVVLPVLHGPEGEDGKMQGFLETLNLPYGFSNVISSALGINKLLQKLLYKNMGLLIPDYQVLKREQSKIINLDFPVVVKPNTQGSSIGISICKNEKEFKLGLENAFKYDDTVLIEEYIAGKEITVGVLGSSKKAFALPVTEIIPKKQFFDYQAKYDGSTEEITPARISKDLAQKAREQARRIFKTLGCSGIARIDMMIKGKDKKAKIKNDEIYVLEINTIPGFTRESLIPKAAAAYGISFEELVDKLVEIALEEKKEEKKRVHVFKK